MIRNDWILQLIQEISRVVSVILRGTTAEDYTASVQALTTASKKYTGLDFKTIQQLPPEALIDLFTGNGVPDINKIFATGMCVYAEALAYTNQADPAGLERRQLKSLHLLLLPFPYLQSEGAKQTAERIEGLRRDLVEVRLPDAVSVLLVPYLQLVGAYAEAENVLFSLLECDVAELKQVGEAFYASVSRQSDEKLREGGLPRAEVAEGRAAFLARLA